MGEPRPVPPQPEQTDDELVALRTPFGFDHALQHLDVPPDAIVDVQIGNVFRRFDRVEKHSLQDAGGDGLLDRASEGRVAAR